MTLALFQAVAGNLDQAKTALWSIFAIENLPPRHHLHSAPAGHLRRPPSPQSLLMSPLHRRAASPSSDTATVRTNHVSGREQFLSSGDGRIARFRTY